MVAFENGNSELFMGNDLKNLTRGFSCGDKVAVLKIGTYKGKQGTVTNPSFNGRVQVKMVDGGKVRSYLPDDIKQIEIEEQVKSKTAKERWNEASKKALAVKHLHKSKLPHYNSDMPIKTSLSASDRQHLREVLLRAPAKSKFNDFSLASATRTLAGRRHVGKLAKIRTSRNKDFGLSVINSVERPHTRDLYSTFSRQNEILRRCV